MDEGIDMTGHRTDRPMEGGVEIRVQRSIIRP